VIADIARNRRNRKVKTLPLINADNTDRKRAVQFPILAISAILAIMIQHFAGEGFSTHASQNRACTGPGLRSTIVLEKIKETSFLITSPWVDIGWWLFTS
jgi:hypothetical protein